MTASTHRHGGERGQVGGMEAVPFGMLVLVIGTLLVASAWAVVDAKLAVVAAAREGARSYVEADTATTGVARGELAAREAMAGHGRRADIDVQFRQPSSFARCALVTVRVTQVLPAVPLPWIGGLGEVTVASSHSERIDPFRDGLEGPATCPP